MIRSVSKMYACKHTSCCNVKDWEPLHPTRQSWRVKDPTSNFVSSRLCATCASSSGVSSLKSQEVQGAKNIGGFPQSWCKGKSCSVLTIDTPHIDTLLPGQDATKKTQWLAERGLWLSCGLLHPVQIFRIQQPWLSQANLQDFPSTTACSTSRGGIIFRSRANWETDIAKVWRFPTGWENSHRWAASSKLPKSRHFFLFQTHIIRHRYVLLLLLLHVLVLAGKEVAICAGNFKSQLLNTGGTRCKSTGWKNWRPFR